MDKTYHIWSKAGHDHGIWEAESAVEALAAMHADAGYPCYVMAGEEEITFRGGCNLGSDGQDLCGQLEDWDVCEVPPGDR